MATTKHMRSVLICINPESRMLTSKMLAIIADEYEMGKELGSITDGDIEVARWMHYEGKLDKIPASIDILITPTFDCDEVYYANEIRNFSGYIEPKWFVAKTEDRREVYRTEDFQIWSEHHKSVGKVVEKRSGNPFKSGLYYGTVKTCERNPYTGLWGFTFEEDESIVDIKQCRYVTHVQ
ncbi:hypothetical protein DQT32_04000 [Salmonella enterica subsp. enterica serovar Braenderup]|nr:hypothetical protein [Salmonella enterica subsp. enterica serovar Braenderup]